MPSGIITVLNTGTNNAVSAGRFRGHEQRDRAAQAGDRLPEIFVAGDQAAAVADHQLQVIVPEADQAERQRHQQRTHTKRLLRSAHSSVLNVIATRISKPPMVGVPALGKCDFGPSSRTRWPI